MAGPAGLGATALTIMYCKNECNDEHGNDVIAVANVALKNRHP